MDKVTPALQVINTRATVGYFLIGLVVLGWIIVFVVRARRRRAPRRSPPVYETYAGAPRDPEPPPSRRDSGRPMTIGWHIDPDDMSQQAYWDGNSWTARQQWNGESWIDV